MNVPGSLPIYATSKDTTVEDDACSALPDSTPNLGKYVVLIKRGGCSFGDKADNAIAHGAKYILYYNNEVDPSYLQITDFVTAMISQADGEYVCVWPSFRRTMIPDHPRMQLVGQFAKKANLKLTFPQDQPPSLIASPLGGLIVST